MEPNNTAFELTSRLTSRGPGRGVVRTLQDVSFRVLTVGEAISLLDARIRGRTPTKVAIANAHTLNIVRCNAEYRQMLTRFTVFNDGIGIDLASRLRYREGFPDNLNGTDFIPTYLGQSSRKLRIFMLGAQSHVVQRAFDNVCRRFPHHEWLGFHDGFFQSIDEPALCEQIRAARVDLLLVAMGNPLQEFWMDRCAASTGATVCVGVGALFDFLSGEVNRAPDWLRRVKLEWIYRLLQEPGRMWRRYLIGNLTFLWHAWCERR